MNVVAKHGDFYFYFNYWYNCYISQTAFFIPQGLTVHSKTAVANAKQHNYPVTEQGDGCITVKAPDGYKFTLVDQDVAGGNKCF